MTGGPFTLAIDCGGSGIKASVLDRNGKMAAQRIRVRTPYPCPPDLFVATLAAMTDALPPYDRVSVGFPGMVRHGRVVATPHYVTEAGPFTPKRADLVAAWSGFDVQTVLADTFGRPTRVLNDAEIAGYAVIAGTGFEMMLTLGTGLGCGLFDEGHLLPKLELSQHPFRKGETYDEQLGDHARRAVGSVRWTRRFRLAVATLRPVFGWDRIYVGGGNGKKLLGSFGPDLIRVPNRAGILGGIRLWELHHD